MSPRYIVVRYGRKHLLAEKAVGHETTYNVVAEGTIDLTIQRLRAELANSEVAKSKPPRD